MVLVACIQYLWQIVRYLYSPRALKEIELDDDDALDQELLGSLDYINEICTNETLVSIKSDDITKRQDSDEQDLLLTSERDVLLSIMDNGYPAVETPIHSPLSNVSHVRMKFYQSSSFCPAACRNFVSRT
jgi:hypothetical protein